MGVGWFYFDPSGRSRAGGDSAEDRFATSGISPIESGRLLQRRRHGEDAADRPGPAGSIQQRRTCGLGSRERGQISEVRRAGPCPCFQNDRGKLIGLRPAIAGLRLAEIRIGNRFWTWWGRCCAYATTNIFARFEIWQLDLPLCVSGWFGFCGHLSHHLSPAQQLK